MKRSAFKFILLNLILGGFLWPASAFCTTPTHTTEMKPSSLSFENSYQVVGIYWLPDYIGSNSSRDGNPDPGGEDPEKTCETYGFATPSSINLSLYDCTDYDLKPVHGLTCYTGCSCKSKFKYDSSNCSGNYTLSGTSCGGKYESCICKSEFKYDRSNCSGEYEPSGQSCGGKYNACTMRSECQVTSRSCPYGCSLYNDCKKCVECAENPDCDVPPVSCSYGCAETNSCGICTSCKSNPDCDVISKSCSYGCASYNSCQKCTVCEEEPACTSNCSGYNYSSSSSCTYGASSCYDNCTGQTWYKCNSAPSHSHAYYCPSGYSTSCSNGYTATAPKECSCGATSGTCYLCKTEDPCDSVTAVSVPANAFCSNYYSSCPSKCSAWSCNSGYKKSGSSCVAENTCTYTLSEGYCRGVCRNVGSDSCVRNGTTYYNTCGSYKCSSDEDCISGSCVSKNPDPCDNRAAVSVPANAFCSSYYSDCSSKCSAWSCNSGYQRSGSGCVKKSCTNTCFYTLRSCPANGYCKECQIIGPDCSVASGGTRYSLVSCHNGTYISLSGDSCVSY